MRHFFVTNDHTYMYVREANTGESIGGKRKKIETIETREKTAKKEEEAARSGPADPRETLNDYSSLLNCLYFHSSRLRPSVRGAHIDTRVRINGDSS